MKEAAIQPAQDLVAMLKDLGVKATLADIPSIMQIGLDRFIDQQGKVIIPENLDGLYIILNTMRQ